MRLRSTVPEQSRYTLCIIAYLFTNTSPWLKQVVGRLETPAIDIYHTKNAGWAVRNPPSYDAEPEKGIFAAHEGRTIKKGSLIGIYAGECIPAREMHRRYR